MTQDDTSVDKQIRRMKERRYNMGPLLGFLAVASLGSFFISRDLFYALSAFTATLLLIMLARNWDDVVIWWATRK